MEKTTAQRTPYTPEAHGTDTVAPPAKQPWQEPKLAFVEPKLTPHGDLKQVTGQSFFGGFSP